MKKIRQRLTLLAAILAVSLISGCGYQLRGSTSLPEVMASTYIKGLRPYSALVNDFTHALRARKVNVVKDAGGASAILNITGNNTEKRVQSVDALGNVLEFELRQTINFYVTGSDQQVLLQEQSISLSRDYLFASTGVLAKAREEKQVQSTLQKNLVNLALLRIASIGK